MFNSSATQAELFSYIQPFVDAAVDGYNSTIFAFGQTNSGKTYTISGHDWTADNEPMEEFSDLESSAGILARTFRRIFERIRQVKTEDTDFTVRCSYMELYNENVFDLLKQ